MRLQVSTKGLRAAVCLPPAACAMITRGRANLNLEKTYDESP
jgi:hypothetical protein